MAYIGLGSNSSIKPAYLRGHQSLKDKLHKGRWIGLGQASAEISPTWLKPLQTLVINKQWDQLREQIPQYKLRAESEGYTKTAARLQDLLDNLDTRETANIVIAAGQDLYAEINAKNIDAKTSSDTANAIIADLEALKKEIGLLQPGGKWNFEEALTGVSAEKISEFLEKATDMQKRVKTATVNASDRANLDKKLQDVLNFLGRKSAKANEAGTSAGDAISTADAVLTDGANSQGAKDISIRDKVRACKNDPAKCTEILPFPLGFIIAHWKAFTFGTVLVLISIFALLIRSKVKSVTGYKRKR